MLVLLLSNMTVFLVLVLILLFLILCIILYGRRNYGILESCGIPVDKPSLFLGSDPYFHRNVRHLQDLRRYKKFGPIWGAYIGGTPQVFIADPELVRRILAADTEYFCDRRDISLGSPIIKELIGYSTGDKWKELRSRMGSLITPAKIKSSVRVMSQCAKEFVHNLKDESLDGRVKIDCREKLIPYMVDMIARIVLGVQINQSHGKECQNEFIKAFKRFMGEETKYNWMYTLSLTFPFLVTLSPTHADIHFKYLEKTLRNILNTQSNNGVIDKKSIVQAFLDFWSKVNSGKPNSRGFSDRTVLAQIIDFFIGGYEAPAAALSHLLLYIAENPKVQEMLQKEIDLAFEKNDGIINSEAIKESEIPYATACIKEALRLCPAIFGPQRICNKDWTCGSITIKKGIPVMVATWAANRNPTVFPDPEKFIPERFLSNAEKGHHINPYAFTTFGHGPRKCIGSQFSYESMKIFLVYMIRNFAIALRSDTQLNYKTGSLMLVNFDPLYLDLTQRIL